MDKTSPKRTSADVLREIETKLATIDGIATSDAFALGSLVREYGEMKAGESALQVMQPILDVILNDKPDEPWRKPR